MLEKDYEVLPFMSAKNMGSGDLEVLASPALVALVENFCKSLVDLSEEESSVGTFFDLNHLKATKIGATIKVKILKKEVEGRKLLFIYEVYEKDKLIAKGSHKRVIISVASFLEKLED